MPLSPSPTSLVAGYGKEQLIKIGIFGKNIRNGASLASLVDEVVGYEEQGFSSYWMQQASTFDVLKMMGLIGHLTSKIELGIATIPTYPRYPGTLVHQARTVNVLAGGRLVIGIGPTAEPEYETLSSSYEESVRHVRDYKNIVEEVGESDDTVLEDDDKANVSIELDFPEPQPHKVIVFLDQGRVLEQGSHEKLLRIPNGRYRRYLDLQTTA